MSAQNATFNFISGNVSDGVEIDAENSTFQFIAGNISGGVSLTEPSRVVINATATGLPEITVEGSAEGSDIDNLGNEELELIAEANVTVAGTINVTGVIPTERTARGSLSLSPTSAIYNNNIDMVITYTLGEGLTNGMVNITVPTGFTIADTDDLTIAGAAATVATNVNAAYNGNILTISNVDINKDQTIVLALGTQAISSSGTYDFTANATNTSKLTSNEATARFTSLLNNDADLSALAVSSGSLNPVFSSGTTNYTVNVTYDISSIDVTATLSDSNASLMINGEAATSAVAKSVTLEAAGEATVISVVVAAEDGITTKTYNLTVNRAATDTTPSATTSGITSQTLGAVGSKEVTLNVTVQNAAGDALTGYVATDFTVVIDGGSAVDFSGSPFSGFTDNSDGNYTVVYTGVADGTGYAFQL
ncbi:cadherin-like beta sandwich domain-containing protein [Methanolobus sediminis]|uniref:Cadherin-like beta sandwich domain-containing protein n=1 Tax=Methanolobus sediminis TaxID=3072978 RepID=A0AA51UJ11_9EURY|nr:cadherin-like beta sandwich domain-containing protein [Methanolobus sediminis]WMW24427.1 cadherin-like beta sandwich domain-containing protein [Methanolobus sediminis]